MLSSDIEKRQVSNPGQTVGVSIYAQVISVGASRYKQVVKSSSVPVLFTWASLLSVMQLINSPAGPWLTVKPGNPEQHIVSVYDEYPSLPAWLPPSAGLVILNTFTSSPVHSAAGLIEHSIAKEDMLKQIIARIQANIAFFIFYHLVAFADFAASPKAEISAAAQTMELAAQAFFRWPFLL